MQDDPIGAKQAPPIRYLVDSYLEWAHGEGAPIHEDFGVDLTAAETASWPRLGDGCRGAIVNLKGRGEHMSVFLIDLPPGGKSAPQRHIYDEIFFVLSGNGSTVVTLADGTEHSFEWGENSLFSPPLNTRYQMFNGSGQERARLVSINDLVFIMNFFRSEQFIFDNPVPFPDREGPASFYSGEGELTSIRPGRNLWETNFVANVASFKLMEWEARGAGSSNMQFLLTEGSIGAHTSEMPVGTYKKAHRHGPGAHVLAVNGIGYTLLWYQDAGEFIRMEWKRGFIYAPPDAMFHQHFNTGAMPARYVAFLFGSKRYPIIGERRANSENRRTDVSAKDGGAQVDYADQDPQIHRQWVKELHAAGVESKMGKYIDETSC
jgi:mannose-6-phosphate isomerase-like protein (cupin superfamily)/oxalate decarboxylase/phosphoglucose isomerase-like protein (cupin superfamily)